MFKNKWKVFVWVWVFLLFVPFVFIRDFYPFMRFGMFAEPYYKNQKTITYQLKSKEGDIVSAKEIALSDDSFQSLARKFKLKSELSVFIKELERVNPQYVSFYLEEIVCDHSSCDTLRYE